jgi:hypothetical protein
LIFGRLRVRAPEQLACALRHTGLCCNVSTGVVQTEVASLCVVSHGAWPSCHRVARDGEEIAVVCVGQSRDLREESTSDQVIRMACATSCGSGTRRKTAVLVHSIAVRSRQRRARSKQSTRAYAKPALHVAAAALRALAGSPHPSSAYARIRPLSAADHTFGRELAHQGVQTTFVQRVIAGQRSSIQHIPMSRQETGAKLKRARVHGRSRAQNPFLRKCGLQPTQNLISDKKTLSEVRI